MKKLLILTLLGVSGCSNLFISYCDRVARGTADANWILDSANTSSIPFSKAAYREPSGSSPGAVCVTAQGPSAEAAAGRNFSYEITDSNDRVIAKSVGKSAAQPINTENQLKLWGGTHQTNKNTFESTECFPVAKLDPFVKVKVKNLGSAETDESKLWSGAAFCKR